MKTPKFAICNVRLCHGLEDIPQLTHKDLGVLPFPRPKIHRAMIPLHRTWLWSVTHKLQHVSHPDMVHHLPRTYIRLCASSYLEACSKLSMKHTSAIQRNHSQFDVILTEAAGSNIGPQPWPSYPPALDLIFCPCHPHWENWFCKFYFRYLKI